MAATIYQYPISGSDPAQEIPHWLRFFAAPYSLQAADRTRSGIYNRAQVQIVLPLPKEPGYTVRHEFGEGTNPVGPVLSMAALNNSGGDFELLWNRIIDPAKFQNEYMYATTTYRRFSNVTEATMVSEARKEYNFEYIFVPKSEAESEAVRGIVGSFRKASYPQIVPGLPERSYPQPIWTLRVSRGRPLGQSGLENDLNYTADWLGEPMPLVLTSMTVKYSDAADSVVRTLPNGRSNLTLLGLTFREFETGTYNPNISGDGGQGGLQSKSEIIL
jgi:hypothetical protein